MLSFHIAQSQNLFEAASQQQQQQQQQQIQQQGGSADDLAALRNQPQLQQLRQLVQQNPALLQQLIQQIDPQLLPVKLIILFILADKNLYTLEANLYCYVILYQALNSDPASFLRFLQ